jgi:hypothetical protein
MRTFLEIIKKSGEKMQCGVEQAFLNLETWNFIINFLVLKLLHD